MHPYLYFSLSFFKMLWVPTGTSDSSTIPQSSFYCLPFIFVIPLWQRNLVFLILNILIDQAPLMYPVFVYLWHHVDASLAQHHLMVFRVNYSERKEIQWTIIICLFTYLLNFVTPKSAFMVIYVHVQRGNNFVWFNTYIPSRGCTR